jgi:hypothetical protein
MNLSELGLYVSYVVVRTERANQLIKRDPKEMPRRLRLLLLAVDGLQDLGTYANNLRGFGEIMDLIRELIQMDMVRLVDPALARQRRMAGKSADYMAMDSVMDDSRFSDVTQTQTDEELFYGTTTPGSLERLVGHAQQQYPDFQPASLSAAPVPKEMQNEQLESLFSMLEAVRSERTELKLRLMRYKDLKSVARNINEQAKRLKEQVLRLQVACGLLAFGLVVCCSKLFFNA